MRRDLSSRTRHGEGISVFVFDKNPVKQPEGFRVCPLGLQFYSPREIQEFQMMEFRLAVPGNGRTPQNIHCSGVVVHCKPLEDRAMFRVWIKFLDLPEAQREQIKCLAKAGKHLCPYCENF